MSNPDKRKSVKWITVVSVLIIAGIIIVLSLARGSRFESIAIIPVNDNTRLELIDVRTGDDPALEITHWQHKVIKAIPAWITTRLTNKRRLALLEMEMKYRPITLENSPTSRTITMFFLAKRLQAYGNWKIIMGDKVKDVESLLKTEGMGYVSLSQKNRNTENHSFPIYGKNISLTVSENPAIFVTSLAPVRTTEKTLEAYFTPEATSRERKNTFHAHNPLYVDSSPLKEALSLPATVTHDNVNVTVHAFVSKTALWPNPFTPESFQKYQALVRQLGEKNQYLRGAGEKDDPYCMGLAVQVWQEHTTSPDWKLKNVEFLAGEYRAWISGPGSRYLDPEHIENEKGWVEWMISGDDLSWYTHPLTAAIQLKRIRNFSPGNSASVSVPLLPGEKQSSKEQTALDGNTITVWTDYTELNVAPYKDQKLFRINYEGIPSGVSMAEAFLTHKDTLTTHSLMSHGAQGGNSSVTYDLLNLRKHERVEPLSIDDFTTLTVTWAKEETHPRTFDFNLKPVEAQVARP